MSDSPRTDALQYYFSNHDLCAGESIIRRIDDKDVTWDETFRGDSVPSCFARELERNLGVAVAALKEISELDPYGDSLHGAVARAENALAAIQPDHEDE